MKRLWFCAMTLTMMSAATLASEAPSICARDVMGGFDDPDVTLCETFVASGKGTARERATALVNLAHSYLRDSAEILNPHKSGEAFKKAAQVDPSFAEPHWAMGHWAGMREDNDTALKEYGLALALDAKHWRSAMGMAQVYMAQKKTERALDWGRKALDLSRDEGIAHQQYGDILLQAGRNAEAAAEYYKATATYVPGRHRTPGIMQNGSPWDAAAVAEERLGHLQRAIDDMTRSIEVYRDNFDRSFAYLARGKFYENAGRNLLAAADYQTALDLRGPSLPDADIIRSKVAALRAAGGDKEGARTAFADVLRTGKLQSVLRVQVFLRNHGFDDVAIDGKASKALEAAVERCLSDKACAETPGLPI